MIVQSDEVTKTERISTFVALFVFSDTKKDA